MAIFRDILFKKSLKPLVIVQSNDFVVKLHRWKHLDTLVVMLIEPGQPTPLRNTRTYILVPIRTVSHGDINYYPIIMLTTLIDVLCKQASKKRCIVALFTAYLLTRLFMRMPVISHTIPDWNNKLCDPRTSSSVSFTFDITHFTSLHFTSLQAGITSLSSQFTVVVWVPVGWLSRSQQLLLHPQQCAENNPLSVLQHYLSRYVILMAFLKLFSHDVTKCNGD